MLLDASPERGLGAGSAAVWRPVFACLCRREVAVLRRRCRQVAGKARLRWVLGPRALADYYYNWNYYYSYYCRPQSVSLRVHVSHLGPQAHLPVAEAVGGTGAVGVPNGAVWGES